MKDCVIYLILIIVGDTMKRRGIFIAILLLAVGFAAVSTTLIINGGARIIADQDNFDIYFSEAVLDNVSSPQLISEDKKTITYTTKDLKVAGETSVLDYVVTNNSTQYDAEVEISCTPSSTEYLTITNEMDVDIIKASTSEAGTLTVRLNKNSTEEIETEFTCTIVANAVERDTVGEAEEEEDFYALLTQNAVLDNIASEYVTSSRGIDFSLSSSDTNGKGLYIIADTVSDPYPIYYYRGDVSNNNVIFGNFCWKIIRTTDTGGIKMIYNGTPSSDGACYNTGDASEIQKSAFNEDNYNSASAVGYMYGTDSNSYYNNDVESDIKIVIDDWFSKNLNNYVSYLENTVYCNDRTLEPGYGDGVWFIGYGPKYRLSTNKTPSLACENPTDSFTIDSSNGNGKLEYPVGLITADEVAYAGGGEWMGNSTYYLYSDSYYWTLSPYNGLPSTVFAVAQTGDLTGHWTNNAYGVRPVISLKKGVQLTSGDGSYTTPYRIG